MSCIKKWALLVLNAIDCYYFDDNYYLNYDSDSMCCILSGSDLEYLCINNVLPWGNSISSRIELAKKKGGFVGFDGDVRLFLFGLTSYDLLRKEYGPYWIEGESVIYRDKWH